MLYLIFNELKNIIHLSNKIISKWVISYITKMVLRLKQVNKEDWNFILEIRNLDEVR